MTGNSNDRRFQENAMNMHEATWAVVEECARGSLGGTMHFGEVVGKLVAAGVESYHADYRRVEITYYLPSGESHAVRLTEPIASIADAFSADGVRAAVQGAQRGDVMYPEFVRLTTAAGCVGYVVWIAGRQVQYFGRRGEIHVELFPAAK
jgi:uncharacterized protein YbcV (DUF1398 family)